VTKKKKLIKNILYLRVQFTWILKREKKNSIEIPMDANIGMCNSGKKIIELIKKNITISCG